MKNRILTFLLIMASCSTAMAQDDPIYRREIGVGVGMANYLGDFNGSLTKNMQPAFSLVYRRMFSTYCGLRFDLNYMQIKGSSDNVTTYFPQHSENAYTFKRNLTDFNAVFEYNFWPYGTGRDYRGAKRITPYIFIGLGMTVASGNGNSSSVAANIPLGIGVKYKVGQRINLGIEWGVHISTSDELDGQKDPYGIVSSGIFKNTDCYSSLRATLTYSFSAKCKTCNKYE
ncbi:MAG: porin family protein [Bacteroidales bacterium]|nr:porin family protein [Bacteroidales bacterium]MCM1146945.1 porin family protein [Bacteroidales bacterium]MCM1207008.1 porin family protein [Bacillota bacterium]MCM1511438.1 porin family protein [Clostridium sp.]